MPKLFAIGGATVDLVGCPYKPLKYQDSNPGQIKLSFGGVARNIAENASRTNTNVSLMALFGDDPFGQLCYHYCENLGMDLSYSKILENQRSATYLALLQNDGEMNCAIADMEILSKLGPNDFDYGISQMSSQDYCSIDTNLSVETLEALCSKIPAKIAMDPISSQKAVKAKSILKYLSVFLIITASSSFKILDVIKHKQTSPYLFSGIKTTAGRSFEFSKSAKGKFTKTTSPFFIKNYFLISLREYKSGSLYKKSKLPPF